MADAEFHGVSVLDGAAPAPNHFFFDDTRIEERSAPAPATYTAPGTDRDGYTDQTDASYYAGEPVLAYADDRLAEPAYGDTSVYNDAAYEAATTNPAPYPPYRPLGARYDDPRRRAFIMLAVTLGGIALIGLIIALASSGSGGSSSTNSKPVTQSKTAAPASNASADPGNVPAVAAGGAFTLPDGQSGVVGSDSSGVGTSGSGLGGGSGSGAGTGSGTSPSGASTPAASGQPSSGQPSSSTGADGVSRSSSRGTVTGTKGTAGGSTGTGGGGTTSGSTSSPSSSPSSSGGSTVSNSSSQNSSGNSNHSSASSSGTPSSSGN